MNVIVGLRQANTRAAASCDANVGCTAAIMSSVLFHTPRKKRPGRRSMRRNPQSHSRSARNPRSRYEPAREAWARAVRLVLLRSTGPGRHRDRASTPARLLAPPFLSLRTEERSCVHRASFGRSRRSQRCQRLTRVPASKYFGCPETVQQVGSSDGTRSPLETHRSCFPREWPEDEPTRS